MLSCLLASTKSPPRRPFGGLSPKKSSTQCSKSPPRHFVSMALLSNMREVCTIMSEMLCSPKTFVRLMSDVRCASLPERFLYTYAGRGLRDEDVFKRRACEKRRCMFARFTRTKVSVNMQNSYKQASSLNPLILGTVGEDCVEDFRPHPVLSFN